MPMQKGELSHTDICYQCLFFGGKAKIRIGFSELNEEHQISVLDLVLQLGKNLSIAPSCTEKGAKNILLVDLLTMSTIQQ